MFSLTEPDENPGTDVFRRMFGVGLCSVVSIPSPLSRRPVTAAHRHSSVVDFQSTPSIPPSSLTLSLSVDGQHKPLVSPYAEHEPHESAPPSAHIDHVPLLQPPTSISDGSTALPPAPALPTLAQKIQATLVVSTLSIPSSPDLDHRSKPQQVADNSSVTLPAETRSVTPHYAQPRLSRALSPEHPVPRLPISLIRPDSDPLAFVNLQPRTGLNPDKATFSARMEAALAAQTMTRDSVPTPPALLSIPFAPPPALKTAATRILAPDAVLPATVLEVPCFMGPTLTRPLTITNRSPAAIAEHATYAQCPPPPSKAASFSPRLALPAPTLIDSKPSVVSDAVVVPTVSAEDPAAEPAVKLDESHYHFAARLSSALAVVELMDPVCVCGLFCCHSFVFFFSFTLIAVYSGLIGRRRRGYSHGPTAAQHTTQIARTDHTTIDQRQVKT